MCPNCSTIFDELLRPKLYVALSNHLKQYGTLPESWKTDNKTRCTRLAKDFVDYTYLDEDMNKIYKEAMEKLKKRVK